jgi:hypothetical protein
MRETTQNDNPDYPDNPDNSDNPDNNKNIVLDNLLEKLNVIQHTGVKKRLTRELSTIIEKGICTINDIEIDDEYNPVNKNSKVEHYRVTINMIEKNRIYDFIIPLTYPFRPPKLKLNLRCYFNYYLNIENHLFKVALNKYKGKNCFCCSSILCSDNWSVFMTLQTILEEVDENSSICREIAYRAVVDFIKRKHLLPDINILEWLY